MADGVLSDMFAHIRQRQDRRRAGWNSNFPSSEGGVNPGMRGQINPLDSQAMADRAQGFDITEANPPTALLAARPAGEESPFRTASYDDDEQDFSPDVTEGTNCPGGKCGPSSAPAVTAQISTTATTPAASVAGTPQKQVAQPDLMPASPADQVAHFGKLANIASARADTPGLSPYDRAIAVADYRNFTAMARDASLVALKQEERQAQLAHLQEIKQNEQKYYNAQQEALQLGLPEPRREMEMRLLRSPDMSPTDVAHYLQVLRDAQRKEAGTELLPDERKAEHRELAGKVAGFRVADNASIALAARGAGQPEAGQQFRQDAWNTIRTHYGPMLGVPGISVVDQMRTDMMKPLTAVFLLHETNAQGKGTPEIQLRAAQKADMAIEAYYSELKHQMGSGGGASMRNPAVYAPSSTPLGSDSGWGNVE